jgi:hypothetical protein
MLIRNPSTSDAAGCHPYCDDNVPLRLEPATGGKKWGSSGKPYDGAYRSMSISEGCLYRCVCDWVSWRKVSVLVKCKW